MNLIDLVFTVLEFLYNLRGLFIPGLALIIAVFSYRFAVKSNIMGVVNGINPVQSGDFNIATDVMEVRWRPNISRQSSRTALNVRVTPLDSSHPGMWSFTDIASKHGITEKQLASADKWPYSTFKQFQSEDGEKLVHTTLIQDYGYRIVLNSTEQKDVYYAIIGAYIYFSHKFEREPQHKGEIRSG